MGWTTAIVLMPVVYLLSLPPMVLSVVCDRKTGIFTPEPTWLKWYVAPGNWLYENMPLAKKPLDSYGTWWLRMYIGGGAP
jgi:hypothetical protein